MEYLDQLKQISIQNHIPIIKDDGCDFLIQFIKKVTPKTILEIGTAVGYSGSHMLNAYEKCFLTTIEVDKKAYEQAKITFSTLNLQNRVKQILGDAKQVIKQLDCKFDLIFLDGPKGQYLAYYNDLKKLLNKGGYIIADNIYFHGLVNGAEFVKHKLRTIVVNMRKFIKTIQEDKDVQTTFYNIADGIAVIKLV